MDEPYRPSKDQSLLKVAVSAARQKEIKQNFYKLLPAVLWKPFLKACAAAYKMRAAQSQNSIARTRDDLKKMLQKSRDLRQFFVQASPLTESYLPRDALDQVDTLITSLIAAEQTTTTIRSTKPSKAYRDELAIKLIDLMEFAGIPVKLSRGYSTRGKSDTFYRLMELAVEMVEGQSPSNLRKHMTNGKIQRDSINKRKAAKIPCQ